jgi:pimeloyl-ACP methyl ester carboxylesterase
METRKRPHRSLLAYDDVGAGPAIVFVHGHPFDRSLWAPQILFFSQRGYRVIAPDLRGYGATPPASEPLDFSDFAADIEALLTELRIETAAMVGVSMGGQIVMELYHRCPKRFRAMVLSDTSPSAETAEGKTRRRAMAERLLREGMKGYATEVLSSMITPANIAAQPKVAEHVLTMMLKTPPAGAAAALRARAERRDYCDMLGQVTVPTLVVVGRDDVFTPVAQVQAMQEQIPSAAGRLCVIEDAGHLPNLEQPAPFNAVLADFLEKSVPR